MASVFISDPHLRFRLDACAELADWQPRGRPHRGNVIEAEKRTHGVWREAARDRGALGLESPWRVEQTEIDAEGRRLDLYSDLRG